MAKSTHEFRDPIHVFIQMDTWMRRIVDSEEVQRLRFIHQLAMSYLVYPGTTHTRFEHSLGVMELSGRAFDVLCRPDNLMHDGTLFDVVDKLALDPGRLERLEAWKRILRTAALTHDIGHFPFSHAAEDLAPEGVDHEVMTYRHLTGSGMANLWKLEASTIDPAAIAGIAVGGKTLAEIGKEGLSNWNALLSEIIAGDFFGVDRMDYLLRDSYHAGVPYGHFDHHRLIDSLRVLRPKASPEPEYEDSDVPPVIGITHGGLKIAEAMALARYSTYTQVYFHPVRRAYDFHLREFLRAHYGGIEGYGDTENHLKLTDVEVLTAIRESARDSQVSGHEHASRILNRGHFRLLRRSRDADPLGLGSALEHGLKNEFGPDSVHRDKNTRNSRSLDFPVLLEDGTVGNSLELSHVMRHLPSVGYDYIFVDPSKHEIAKRWLKQHEDRLAEDSLPTEENQEQDRG